MSGRKCKPPTEEQLAAVRDRELVWREALVTLLTEAGRRYSAAEIARTLGHDRSWIKWALGDGRHLPKVTDVDGLCEMLGYRLVITKGRDGDEG